MLTACWMRWIKQPGYKKIINILLRSARRSGRKTDNLVPFMLPSAMLRTGLVVSKKFKRLFKSTLSHYMIHILQDRYSVSMIFRIR